MTKLNYTRPTVIDHGTMVAQTKGQCVCQNEDSGFKPVPPA